MKTHQAASENLLPLVAQFEAVQTQGSVKIRIIHPHILQCLICDGHGIKERPILKFNPEL